MCESFTPANTHTYGPVLTMQLFTCNCFDCMKALCVSKVWSVWLFPHLLLLTINKPHPVFPLLRYSEGWVLLVICSRTANGVLHVPALVPVEKHIVTWPKKDGDSSSHGSPVSRYYTCFLRRQCSPHCLPREQNTKHSGRQCICSKDGQGS